MENLEPQTERNLFGMQKRKYSEVEIEEGLETLSTYLDGLFRVPGTGWKFGLDMENDVENDGMFVILVDLHVTGNADFYIYRRNELSRRVREVHSNYVAIAKRDGTPRKSPPFR
mgnify:CR=1 FL=1